jgi:hypothetical protein
MLLPRAVWWVLYGLTLVNFAMSIWASFFDRAHWHPDAIWMDVAALALASYRLAYPPGTSRDQT